MQTEENNLKGKIIKDNDERKSNVDEILLDRRKLLVKANGKSDNENNTKNSIIKILVRLDKRKEKEEEEKLRQHREKISSTEEKDMKREI